jgi:hypothetical protein
VVKLAGCIARSAAIRRGVFSLLCAGLALLACGAAPALAAPPEAPEVTVETPVRAAEATVHGVLNPGKVGEPGTYEMETYEFLYKTSTTGACKGGSVAPAAPGGLSLGGGKEEVSEVLPALTADTEYAVCLEVEGAGGKTVSAPTTFKTALPPEAPHTTSPAKSVAATTATLEGVLNPVKAREAGSYEFLYRVSPSECEGESAAPSEPSGTMTGAAKQAVSVAVTGLQPSATYTFCLLARNGAGETALGAPVHFTTKAAAPIVEVESVSGVHSTSATLEAQVNPNNQLTTYEFEYSESATGETLNAPVTSITGTSTLEGFGNQTVSAATGAVLAPATTYFYRVSTENAAHEKKEGEVASFTTVPTPSTAQIGPITATTATFNGSLTPLNATVATEYSFDYEVGTECTGGSVTTSEGAGTGSGEKTVSTEATGLLPNTQYAVCLVASNAFGSEQASPVRFTTLVAAPAIESESSSDVDASEAQLEARINPGNSATSYHFEYGPAAGSYDESIPVPAGLIHAGLSGVSVSAAAIGLEPSTTYHYRVAASNALPGTVDGADETFTTTGASSAAPPGSCPNEYLREEQPYGLTLPDCRAYEMVSPPDTNGQDATSADADSAPRASEAPTGTEPAITYSSQGSFGEPNGALVENQYVSRRKPSGWTTQAITPLSSTPIRGDGENNEDAYLSDYFNSELTSGLLVTSARLGEAPDLDGDLGVYVAQFATDAYQFVGPIAGEIPSGASTELSRVVLLNPGNGSLLEWVDGTDMPVSVTNSNTEMSATPGAVQYFGGEKDAWHATSENGTRVYFTAPPNLGESNQLYVRVNIGELQSALGAKGECLEPTKACTVEISASEREPEDPSGAQPARYWGASADGAKVFFTSNAELTQNAYTGSADNAANLYEYDLATGKLTDLTGEETDPAGDGAAVQGVVQISDDGAYVYFVADGALKGPGGAALHNSAGEEPVEEEEKYNLYVSHDGGEPTFIATLAQKDQTDWLNGESTKAGPEINTAVVAPSGKRLAFISERTLPTANFHAPGYDNEQARGGECEAELESHESESGMCREVYLYDAETNELECASCNSTGARPVGPANLGGVVPASEEFADYRPRDLLEDGTLFFDSKDALAPDASGAHKNVYAYENGDVHAISNVAGGYEAFFLDASPNGENVFFASADRLLPEDPGGNTVVWDARVDGGFPLANTPAPCQSEEACQPPAAPPPVFGAPASETFSGPGNAAPQAVAPAKPVTQPKLATETKAEKLAKALKACRKVRSKSKRMVCERAARKKYGAKKKAKTAGDERRASR